MATEKTEIETFFGRCRCCLAYGYLKNMWSEHLYEGETEIYGEMLVQCFALTWDHSEEAVEQDQICEQCICRLRDATDFKKVILDSQEELVQQIEDENKSFIKEECLDEEYLMEYHGPDSEGDTEEPMYADTEYSNYADDAPDSVKDETEYEEVEYLEDDDAVEAHDAVDTDSSQPTDKLRPVKRRKPQKRPDTDDEGSKRKWPKKLPKSERHKTYKQYSEEDLRKCLVEVRKSELTPSEASLKYNIPKKTICAKMKLDPNDVRTDIHNSTNNAGARIPMTRSQTKVPTQPTRKQKPTKTNKVTNTNSGKKVEEQNKYQMMKHKSNLKIILKYSNATVIKGKSAAGYPCCFCDKHFSPKNLKKHTLEHGDVFDDAIKVQYVSDLIVKLDITGLKCNLCGTEMDKLEELIEHLKQEHNKTFFTDIKNHFIPFKFETEKLQCAICGEEFKYFKLLSEHMCEHYSNYKCAVCERAFINQRSMQTHSYRHIKGEYKCSQCPKTFDSPIKIREHEHVTHKLSNKKRKCGYCDEKFSSADLVKVHESKKHGTELPDFDCEACDKVFHSQKALTIHKKRYHLIMRPFKCDFCEKDFFTRQELKWHTVTHTKTKDYHCKECGNSFGTQPLLNQHLRAHRGHRKYKCDYCDRAYVHLSTWKMHVMVQHGKAAGSTRNRFND